MGLLSLGSGISGIAGLGAGLAQNFFGSKRDGAKSRVNIETLKAELNTTGGLYKPSLYVVQISRKNNIPFFEGGKPLEMVLANSAALPGIQIITNDYKRQGYGTFDRRPFGVMVTDIPITFFVDNNGEVLNAFNKWANDIVFIGEGTKGKNGIVEEHAINTVQASRPSAGVPNSQQLFEVGYRDDYLSTIRIFCLTGAKTNEGGNEADLSGMSMVEYTLNEAYPIQIGDISVAWNDNDSFATLPVQFTFRTYTITHHNIERDMVKESKGTRAFSLGETLGLISGAAGRIGAFEGASTQSILTNGVNILTNRRIVSGISNIL